MCYILYRISLPYTIARAELNIRPKQPTKLGLNDPGPKRLRPKRPTSKLLRAVMTQGWNERLENAVVVVEQERTCRVVHLIIWLSILFGCEYSGHLIYICHNIIVFPYTYDTGAVTGTEPGVEFYTLRLIEINIAAFEPFNIALFKTNFNSIFFLN